MKKFWNILKKVLIVAGSIASVIAFFMLMIAANEHQEAILFSKLNINIDHHKGLFFVSDEDVENTFQMLYPDSQISIVDVDLNKFERLIENNPFIEEVEVFADMKGTVSIAVIQKQPVIRIINNNGVSYYFDEKGDKMPVSDNFTLRVPVATGFIETADNPVRDSVVKKQLFDLISFIRDDEFLLALCEQIDVNEKGEFEIIPKFSIHRFLIGDASELGQKFKRMKIFYNEVMKSDTVQNFNIVNLKYNNQIICTKTI
jgi:cell division protein FtsQ